MLKTGQTDYGVIIPWQIPWRNWRSQIQCFNPSFILYRFKVNDTDNFSSLINQMYSNKRGEHIQKKQAYL